MPLPLYERQHRKKQNEKLHTRKTKFRPDTQIAVIRCTYTTDDTSFARCIRCSSLNCKPNENA